MPNTNFLSAYNGALPLLDVKKVNLVGPWTHYSHENKDSITLIWSLYLSFFAPKKRIRVLQKKTHTIKPKSSRSIYIASKRFENSLSKSMQKPASARRIHAHTCAYMRFYRLWDATSASAATAAIEAEAAGASAAKVLPEVDAAEAAEEEQLDGGVEHQSPLHRCIQPHCAFVRESEAKDTRGNLI